MTRLNLTLRSPPSSQKYDWVKPDIEIPTFPSSQKYDWIKTDNEIPTLPSSEKYDWIKPDNEIPTPCIFGRGLKRRVVWSLLEGTYRRGCLIFVRGAL